MPLNLPLQPRWKAPTSPSPPVSPSANTAATNATTSTRTTTSTTPTTPVATGSSFSTPGRRKKQRNSSMMALSTKELILLPTNAFGHVTAAAAAAAVTSAAGVKNDEEDVELYCTCRTPYDPARFMICCDGCDDWFHGSCVNVSEEAGDLVDKYYCPACSANDRKSSWKEKCGRVGCSQPALAASRYCSRKCGILVAEDTLMRKDEKFRKLIEQSRKERAEKTVVAGKRSSRKPAASRKIRREEADGRTKQRNSASCNKSRTPEQLTLDRYPYKTHEAEPNGMAMAGQKRTSATTSPSYDYVEAYPTSCYQFDQAAKDQLDSPFGVAVPKKSPRPSPYAHSISKDASADVDIDVDISVPTTPEKPNTPINDELPTVLIAQATTSVAATLSKDIGIGNVNESSAPDDTHIDTSAALLLNMQHSSLLLPKPFTSAATGPTSFEASTSHPAASSQPLTPASTVRSLPSLSSSYHPINRFENDDWHLWKPYELAPISTGATHPATVTFTAYTTSSPTNISTDAIAVITTNVDPVLRMDDTATTTPLVTPMSDKPSPAEVGGTKLEVDQG